MWVKKLTSNEKHQVQGHTRKRKRTSQQSHHKGSTRRKKRLTVHKVNGCQEIAVPTARLPNSIMLKASDDDPPIASEA